MDDITAAHQLVNGHIPLVAENRGFALPVMYVFTNNTVIDKRARALADLREIIQQDGTRIASEEMPYRIAYKGHADRRDTLRRRPGGPEGDSRNPSRYLPRLSNM